MSSLFIDRQGTELKSKGDVIICYQKGERIGTIPLAPVERIFLRGDVQIQASLLGKLGERGIGVIGLSGRKNIPSMLYPQPHKDAYRRVAQYELSNNSTFCLAFSQKLLQLKFLSQQQWLEQAIYRKPALRFQIHEQINQLKTSSKKLFGAKQLASLRGIEGIAARSYFSLLSEYLPSSLGFNGRNRKPPKDPFNAALSFAYTLLHSETVLACYSKGLDPYIGFYHALDFGRESLACDLMEPLRALVDDWLSQLFQQKQLRVEHFSTTDKGCFLGKVGRVIFYKAYEQQAAVWRKILKENCQDMVNLLEKLDVINKPQGKNINLVTDLQNLSLRDWQKLLTPYYFNQCNLLERVNNTEDF